MESCIFFSEWMNYHNANSIRWRGGTGDALTAAARRFIRTKSSMKLQVVRSATKSLWRTVRQGMMVWQQLKMTDDIHFSDIGRHSNCMNSYKKQQQKESSKKIDITLIPRYGGTCAIWYEKIIWSTIRKTRIQIHSCAIVNPFFLHAPKQWY